MTQEEIDAAAERLRRVRNGEAKRTVYRHPRDEQVSDLERLGHAELSRYVDMKTVSNAYLSLGKRMPDETRILADGKPWDVTGSPDEIVEVMRRDGYDDARLVTVAVFLKEVQE